MGHRFLEIATSPAARDEQSVSGSRTAYGRGEGGPDHHDRLTPDEAMFIAARDSFYIASVSADGWPYIQHRGGPTGFLKVLDDRQIGFADYRGNRQYLTVGNIAGDDRVALFLMDYPNQRRLKLLGRMRVVRLEDQPGLAAEFEDPAYPARVERAMVITIDAFDWNCPQHITPRFSVTQMGGTLTSVRKRISELETENQMLQNQIRRLETGSAQTSA